MSFPKACVALVALVVLGSLSTTAPVHLEDVSDVMRTGTPDRVVFDAPPASVSADEVVMFEAIIYDPVNNPLAGEIQWSSSNGTVSDLSLIHI